MDAVIAGNVQLVPPDRVSAHEQQMHQSDPRFFAQARLAAHLAEEQRAQRAALEEDEVERTRDLEVTIVSRDSEEKTDEETPRKKKSRTSKKVSQPFCNDCFHFL